MEGVAIKPHAHMHRRPGGSYHRTRERYNRSQAVPDVATYRASVGAYLLDLLRWLHPICYATNTLMIQLYSQTMQKVQHMSIYKC